VCARMRSARRALGEWEGSGREGRERGEGESEGGRESTALRCVSTLIYMLRRRLVSADGVSACCSRWRCTYIVQQTETGGDRAKRIYEARATGSQNGFDSGLRSQFFRVSF
jgi:hypothetical protein